MSVPEFCWYCQRSTMVDEIVYSSVAYHNRNSGIVKLPEPKPVGKGSRCSNCGATGTRIR